MKTLNGKIVSKPALNENNTPKLVPLNNDLPGTVKDRKDFNRIIDNFETGFGTENTKRVELIDTTYDKIKLALQDVIATVKKNKDKNIKTFFSLFYCGHGAMVNNQQVFILNGEEKMKKSRDKSKPDEKHW
eukprot:CAMPEP_0176371774 /NCGR_PEP_ID=MMETSP0126-20121128/24938_1 /TAXON_ID=141414 ORGANISM="Strombidinopsis acuminatum, Strain SPMC142" /NCGR_SAMPLE_ID=MMETSP0126 /ASSEMBLY_ACC=CAM_ASM_000229 /LENGTH=130 /DNA_ID=CAMNT_0017731375 /DNA_START=162 /DNA_END=550 /DNA_ORIENTATION=+